MRKQPAVFAMLVAGVLLAIAVAALLREPVTTQRDGPTHAASAAAPGPASAATAAPADGSNAEEVAPPDAGDDSAGAAPSNAADVARLTGQVLVRDERVPIAGLKVTVKSRPPGGETAEQDALTDADGRFTFEFPGTVELNQLAAAAGPATAPVRQTADGTLVPPAQRTIDIEVTRGAEISGHVVDEHDAPVIGAIVQAFDSSPFDVDEDSRPERESRTDTAGRFVLAAVGSPVTIVASAPDRVCTRARTGEPSGGHSYDGIDLRVGPAHELAGRVVGDAGAAVAGAELHLYGGIPVTHDSAFAAFAPWPLPTTSDESGGFDFALPAAARDLGDWQLEVEHADYTAWERSLPADAPLTIVLSRGLGFVLVGVVTDTAGAPIAGASVDADGVKATSGADGSYRIVGQGEGQPVDVCTHASGHAILVEQAVALDHDGDTRHDIVLGRGRELAGQVTDAVGQAVRGVRVIIEGDRVENTGDTIIHPKPTWERAFRLDSTVTDGDGRFRIADLYDGAFTVSAESPSDADTRAVATTESPDENLHLVLPDPEAVRVHLAGRLSDAMTGAPIEHATLTFFTREGEGTWTRDLSAPQGLYDVLGPMAGEYQLEVKAADHATSFGALRDWTAGRQPLNVALDPLRTLVVRVVRPDGQAVPHANLVLSREDGLTLSCGDQFGQKLLMVTADDGELRVVGLPAAVLALDVRQSADIAQQPVDLRADAEQTVRIVLAPLAVRKLGVSVTLGHKPAAVPADVDAKSFHAAVGKHHVSPYSGPATLVVQDADGHVVAQASATVDGDRIVEQCTDAGGQHNDFFPAVAVEFILTVPPDALTLELTVPGHDVWRGDVPASPDNVHRVAVLKDS